MLVNKHKLEPKLSLHERYQITSSQFKLRRQAQRPHLDQQISVFLRSRNMHPYNTRSKTKYVTKSTANMVAMSRILRSASKGKKPYSNTHPKVGSIKRISISDLLCKDDKVGGHNFNFAAKSYDEAEDAETLEEIIADLELDMLDMPDYYDQYSPLEPKEQSARVVAHSELVDDTGTNAAIGMSGAQQVTSTAAGRQKS